MSITHCALSGAPLLHPVVSTKTGHVFEKSTILSYIQATGRCPLTDTELTELQLVALTVPATAKSAVISQSSVPELLSAFSTEWDAAVIETFKLKEHVDSLRKQLAHSLYQHDAACRVIARLLKEKEELVGAMQELSNPPDKVV